jgi:hypothetical protein
MSMSPQDWRDLASVYETGAKAAEGYGLPTPGYIQAAALRAQARRCYEIADRRDRPSGAATGPRD